MCIYVWVSSKDNRWSDWKNFRVIVANYYYQVAEINPRQLLNDEKPKLIDEWQITPIQSYFYWKKTKFRYYNKFIFYFLNN